ncbi:signal peptidase I [Lactococcus formosensis]|uniref:signal peptidase I n=1 Tax=Lactococcus formosensis TaxID=1281486 RepID=UPI0024351752|nr:signal peptidase I [Lactococcus formosensis]MDG6119072.1 signal peptidase I [Lactococcus formosensis]
MGKAQSQLDNIKDWDLSGGGGFTLSALEFSQDIQAQLNEVKRILAASEAKREDTPLVDTPLVDTPLVDTPLVDTPLVDTPLVDTPLVDTPLVDTLRNEVIIEKEVNVTSKINHREEKELVSETPNQRMEDKEEVSDTSSYHYYNAFPQEAKQYPTLIVSELTATPAVRSDFYHPGSPELYFDNYQDKRPAKSKSKGASLLSNAFFYLIIIVLLIFVESRLILQDEASKPINIGGFSPMTVLSNSMRSVYPRNSFLLTRQVDANTLDIGDDITFITESDRVVTHRITGIEENHLRTRERGFTTKGVDNQREDSDIVHASNIIGQVIFSSYPLGRAIHFIRNNLIVSVIVMLITMLLLHEVMNFIVMSIKHKRFKSGHKRKRTRRNVTEGKDLSHEAV